MISYKVSDIRKSLDKEKLEKEYNTNFIGHFVYRKLSFYITYLFLNYNISANMVTILSIILCLSMPVLVYYLHLSYLYVAFISFIFYLLDHIDDRDRIDVMDELGKESIESANAFTRAPSSILSAASMFTGILSIFISHHFND
jgi:hypothetical protein